MGIDLSKLRPEPWEAGIAPEEPLPTYLIGDNALFWCRIVGGPNVDAKTQAEFFVLARRVFGIMQRRGPDFFLPQRSDHDGKIIVDCPCYGWIPGRWDDPFTAICASEDWYKQNVEGKAHE